MLREGMLNLSCLEKVAVTGATGFIGGHLVRLLASAGCRPTLLGRSEKYGGLLAGLERQVLWTSCDLLDGESVQAAIRKEKPNTLFHLAGTRRGCEAADCASLNFYGTAQLLEESRKIGVRRIVIAGSAEEYGKQTGPLNERLSLKPSTLYGISKALATKHALALNARDGCPVVVVRPFSVYGPGQPGEMFVAQAIKAAVREVPFKMSTGEQKRDLVFVADVVRGLIRAAMTPRIEGKVINLATGRPNRLRDVAGRIWQISGTSAPLVIGALKPGPDELCDTWADVVDAAKLLDWRAEVKLDEGLRQTIGFARVQYGDKVQLCQTA